MKKFKLFPSAGLLLLFAFPMLPLLMLGHYYCSDWLNHLWPVGFLTNSLKSSFSIPPTISTSEMASIPYHAFYGGWLYRLSAFIGTLSSPEIGLRAVIALTYVAQVTTTYLAFRKVGSDKLISVSLSLLTGWLIYPMTTLYNRGAIAEYVSTITLNTIAALIILLIYSERKNLIAIALTVAFVWLGGNHPISALYGGISVVVASVLLLFIHSRNSRQRLVLIAYLGSAALVALLIISPTIYMVTKYASELHIAAVPALIFVDTVDTFIARIFPIPFDKRSILNGVRIDTPYLEAQISIAFLFLVVYGLERSRKCIFQLILLFGATYLFWMSISYSPWKLLPAFFQIIQFPYRLVSFINFFLFSILFSINFTKIRKTIPIVLTYAFVCLIMKEVHVGAVKTSKSIMGVDLDPTYLTFVNDEGPLKNYTSTRYEKLGPSLEKTANQLKFPIHTAKDTFGKTGTVSPERIGWQITNIAAFPWNRIYLNEREIPKREMAVSNGRIAFKSATHGAKIALKVIPEPGWTLLNHLSNAVSALLFIAGLLTIATERRSRARN